MRILNGLLFSAALLLSPAVKGQQTTQPQPQQPASSSGQSQRAPSEEQEVVNKALDDPSQGSTPETRQTTAPAAQGCQDAAGKSKKPLIGLRLPARVQRTLDAAARKAAQKAGVEVDSHAPADAIKDAQARPCPVVPAKQ